MKIRTKLITIIVLIFTVSAISSSLLLWNSYLIRHKAQYVIPAFNYLHIIARTSANICRQMETISDYLVTAEAADRQEFEAFGMRTDVAFKQWRLSCEQQRSMDVPGEDQDLTRLTAIEIKYLDWSNRVRSVLNQKTDSALVKNNDLITDLIRDDRILSEIDEALEDGIDEIHHAYHDLLLSMGSIPWLSQNSSELLESSHTSIEYFIAAIKASDSLYRQKKAMTDYLLTGENRYLSLISRYGIQIEESLSKWSQTVSKKMVYDRNDGLADLKQIEFMKNRYYKLQESTARIISLHQAGNRQQAVSLVTNQFEVLLNKEMLPAISLAMADSKQELDDLNNRLFSVANLAIWQALDIIACFALLITAIVVRLMKGLFVSIEKIRNGIEIIGAGNLDHRLNLQTNDELGNLATSFDSMTDQLKRKSMEIVNLNSCLEDKLTQLEAANREIESFSYMVSHDLRNPVTAISCYIDILQEECRGKLNEDSFVCLQKIELACQRMKQLIDDILQLSQVSRMDVIREEVDASDTARGIINNLKIREPRRQVNFVCRPGMRINASPQLLMILLENLLSNAWKYSRNVEEAVIQFDTIRENGKDIYFVRDNGAGFDMLYANKLFTAFQRLHTDREFEGTGIGLAISKKIIECHGGRIWVESAVGQGTSLYFTVSS